MRGRRRRIWLEGDDDEGKEKEVFLIRPRWLETHTYACGNDLPSPDTGHDPYTAQNEKKVNSFFPFFFSLPF